jgi:hypothetical protein
MPCLLPKVARMGSFGPTGPRFAQASQRGRRIRCGKAKMTAKPKRQFRIGGYMTSLPLDFGPGPVLSVSGVLHAPHFGAVATATFFENFWRFRALGAPRPNRPVRSFDDLPKRIEDLSGDLALGLKSRSLKSLHSPDLGHRAWNFIAASATGAAATTECCLNNKRHDRFFCSLWRAGRGSMPTEKK